MTVTHLKRGKPQNERTVEDAKVRRVVADTLTKIEAEGDVALRELSEKFDGYTPDAFRLTEAEIEGLIAELTPRDLVD